MNMKQSCKALICAIEGELDGRHCTEEQAAAILDHALPSLTEALARVEAERDEARFEVMSYSAQFDAAQAQLAEAVGLFWFIQGYLEEDRNVHVKARIRSFISRHRLDEHAQAKQQEGEYYCKVCRNHGCVSGCHPDYYKQQEAQGAQAVDERAVYETWLAEKALSLPLLRGVTNLRYLSGNGQYVNDWAMFGYMVWIARAALATQPAVRGAEHDQ